jgi:hypothetical protein
LSSKEHEADQADVEAGFWTREEYCRFRNIPPSQERRERAAGNGPRFLIADRNGRVLYPVAEVKEYVRSLPTFGSRAEVYAAFPSLVERDAQQSENLERQRKRRWTAETRARHAVKSRGRKAKAAAAQS